MMRPLRRSLGRYDAMARQSLELGRDLAETKLFFTIFSISIASICHASGESCLEDRWGRDEADVVALAK